MPPARRGATKELVVEAPLEKLQRLRELQASVAALRAANLPVREWYHDLPGFAANCLKWPDGQRPTGYQREVWAGLEESGRMAVRAPHGVGKSALAAITVLWFALTRDGEDWKVPTTASAWRQLSLYLWPEIHKWARLLDWDAIGRGPFARDELLDLNLKLTTGAAFALASDQPASLEGAHADHILYVVDEGKTVPAAVFDSIEGAFSGTGEVMVLLLSVPGEPVGMFYDICSHKPGKEDWSTRHITKVEAIEAGQMSVGWAEQRGRDWGEDSAIYQNRVLGEFASADEDGIIPLSWVEAANDRYRALEESSGKEWWLAAGLAVTASGVDVARSGPDETVIALRYGDAVGPLRKSRREDTVQTVSRVQAALTGAAEGPCWIDVIGVGAGVFDALRYQRVPPVVHFEAYNASEGTKRRDRTREFGFINVRAAGWWNMREMLDPANGLEVALPPDDLLTGDLCAPHWWVAAGAKIQVEKKEDIVKRLGRSPDSGDAVVQAFWAAAFKATISHASGPVARPPINTRPVVAGSSTPLTGRRAVRGGVSGPISTRGIPPLA